MESDSDADALRWAGESDPTHMDAPQADPELLVAVSGEQAAPGAGSLLLVAYGIFAGIYLLLSMGWFATVLRNTLTLPSLIPEIMYQFGEFLAIVAPALWMGTVLHLTRGRRSVLRVLWLVAGMIVLLPWPIILGRG